MTITTLLDDLRERGVELWAEGDRLRFSAPKGVMTPALRQELAERKAELLALLHGGRAPQPAPPRIPRVARDRPPPLSFLQQRLWFLDQLYPASSAYNVAAALRLSGALDAPALERGLRAVLARHETLRTTVALVDREPAMAIAPPPAGDAAPLLNVVDLQALDPGRREDEALARATEAARQPFDLTSGTLLRATLLRLGPAEHVLVLVTHHFAADGWSVGILVHELLALYQSFAAGGDSRLPAPSIQFADYAAWQRDTLRAGAHDDQLAYWKRQLAGEGPALALPADRPRPAVRSFRGATHTLHLSQRLTHDLKAFSRQERVTLFTTLLAAFQTLLHRYTRQDQITVATAVSNRNVAEVEGLIGPFSNNLLLRAGFSGNPSFRDALARVSEATIGAMAHQDLPFERLVEELRPERDLSHNPLFQVMFVLQNAPQQGFELPGLLLSPFEVDNQTAKFDLTVSMHEAAGRLAAVCEYSSDLFDAATIERLLGHFEVLLAGAVADPTRPVGELPLLSEAERRVLADWNATAVAWAWPGEAPDPCAHTLFELQARCTPNALAVVAATASAERLTYAELDRRATELAARLRAVGVGPEALVGLSVERSPEMVIGLLAILKAGGAYLPLDPHYPEERLAFMIADARPRALLIQQRLLPRWEEQLAGRRRSAAGAGLTIVDMRPEPAAAASDAAAPTADNLAYVIYTSGSTGRPKGAQLIHRGLVNLAAAQLRAFDIRADSRLLQFAPFSFDASVSEIFTALLVGATLHLGPPGNNLPGQPLFQLLRDHAITTVTLPPSALATLPADELPALHTLVVAGEACAPELVARWAPGRRFVNAYGPTETTVCATTALCEADGGPPPIGRPIENTQAYILDDGLQAVPVGVPGELFVGGAGLARGYLGRPDLSAERFLPNPFADAPGERMYRTGDLVRRRAEGQIEFLGRVDYQVKLRGFRVELGEIEVALRQHPGVRSSVAVVREDVADDARLVAYVVGAAAGDGPALLTPENIHQTLRGFLQGKLPDYMIPAAFVLLDALPLSPSGKVDRARLPAPGADRHGARPEGGRPRSPLEARLARIWEEVLGVGPVGVADNFFAIGGHSLLAVRLLDQVRRQIGQAVPLTVFFQEATVEQMASAILQGSDSLSGSSLVALQPRGAKPPFFCVHPALGVVFPYYELAQQLGAGQPFYGLQAAGLDGKGAPYTRIEDMARHYLEALRVVQPTGPYYLGGWSLGSLVAFEMAQQLAAQGQQVALLCLFDTPAPLVGHRPSAPALLRFAGALLALTLRHIWPYLHDYYALVRANASGGRGAAPGEGSAGGMSHDELWLLFRQPAIRSLARVLYANSLAVLRYQPQPYAGRLTLFRATEHAGPADADPAMGWGKLATGGVEVHAVGGHHLNMLRRPHVHSLAERLGACLAHAHSSPGGTTYKEQGR